MVSPFGLLWACHAHSTGTDRVEPVPPGESVNESGHARADYENGAGTFLSPIRRAAYARRAGKGARPTLRWGTAEGAVDENGDENGERLWFPLTS